MTTTVSLSYLSWACMRSLFLSDPIEELIWACWSVAVTSLHLRWADHMLLDCLQSVSTAIWMHCSWELKSMSNALGSPDNEWVPAVSNHLSNIFCCVVAGMHMMTCRCVVLWTETFYARNASRTPLQAWIKGPSPPHSITTATSLMAVISSWHLIWWTIFWRTHPRWAP